MLVYFLKDTVVGCAWVENFGPEKFLKEFSIICWIFVRRSIFCSQIQSPWTVIACFNNFKVDQNCILTHDDKFSSSSAKQSQHVTQNSFKHLIGPKIRLPLSARNRARNLRRTPYQSQNRHYLH